MCNFFSFTSLGNGDIYFFDVKLRKEIINGYLKDKNYNVDSHSSINDYFKLNDDKTNKYEYCPFTKRFIIDQLKVNDDSAEVKKRIALIDFKKLIKATLPVLSLDVRGCDLKDVKLPESIGGSLDVRGCDLKGVKLPESIGGALYVSGCDLKGVKLPESIGGALYVSGCDLKGVKLPKNVKVVR